MGRSEVAGDVNLPSLGSAVSDVGCHLSTMITGMDGGTEVFFGEDLIDEELS
jgi:hypothetical protein